MPDKEGIANEFDGPWKVALEIYLRSFLQLCFPAVHDLIDWAIPTEFLNTELQQLGPAHEHGALTVDRLVKVRLLDGQFEWLFIHVEVQAQRHGQFARRMFTYHYRIWDKFGQSVVSMAVLADNDPMWRPSLHETDIGGCRLRFEFPVCKVIAIPNPAETFARTGNPFALVVAAHQSALATMRDAERRYVHRFQLLRRLADLGMDSGQARELWKVILMLTRLPPDFELKFRTETTTVRHMSIKDLITPWEEIVMEEGHAKGQIEGQLAASRVAILDALEARFGPVDSEVAARLEPISDLEVLRQLHRLAVTEPSMELFLAQLGQQL